MFEINDSLIEREDDRSLFDPARFFVFKFNVRGYELLSRLRETPFSKETFLEQYASIHMTEEAAESLWEKCRKHHIVIESRVLATVS